MSKIFIIIIIIIVIVFIGAGGYLVYQSKINPQGGEEKANIIKVDNPKPNQVISSPLVVTGQARGFWFFEADFPIKLFDENGLLLAAGIAQAMGDWMTEDFVGFSATLSFAAPSTLKGKLVLEKDNPSGLPEYSDELIIPVYFKAQP